MICVERKTLINLPRMLCVDFLVRSKQVVLSPLKFYEGVFEIDGGIVLIVKVFLDTEMHTLEVSAITTDTRLRDPDLNPTKTSTGFCLIVRPISQLYINNESRNKYEVI